VIAKFNTTTANSISKMNQFGGCTGRRIIPGGKAAKVLKIGIFTKLGDHFILFANT
jgi:hypothetical protein